MLPPVPKIPAADAAYGASATPTPRGQQKEVAQPQASNAAPGNGSSLFARAAIASLASEFQLSRSTAILAETLGKLMNLPRQDGEAIQAYVVRLTDAIRALPAPQRLALEQQVAKVLQGLSLSMLAEILKQPTGPDAARLALLIELSRYKGMDLAAKAVVSSYQQNNSANPTPAQPQQPKAQTPQGQNADSRPNAAAAAQLSNTQTTGRLLSQFIGLPALGAAAVKAIATAQAALPDQRTNLPASPADLPDSLPEAARADGKAESAARPPQLQTGTTAKEGTVPAETHSAKSPRAENAEMRPALPLRDVVKAEQKDARAALLQPSGQPAGDARDMENLLLAALAGKLPARATATTQPAATPPGIPPQQPEEQPAEKTASATTAARPSGEETETIANRPEAQPLPRAAIDPEARMAMLEQSASQSLIAAALAKEGTPLPLVAYPPAEDDHESESPHRGSGPFSEEETEGEPEGENPGAQDEAEERVAANDETDEPEAASDDSAENYYLRMSGML
ncbi:hypothetical protein [Agrobacterium tumefaciens]|uniref:hypothetical protein n=1 Tax=Agrobacterium tumefaciens TaxID=358 RepID=UPI00045AFBC7|nr:hypothetical protein [Agrobacterium tumefaciens]CDN94010.1 hypothetical protein BN949_03172 [Agrobacterium tumefaciens]